MAETVTFTGSIDRTLLKRAKMILAKSGTSVNALFNAELHCLVETYEAAEAGNNHNFKNLLDFSLGRADVATVMASLGLDSEEDLFLLMAHARLPMPRLAAATTEAMADGLQQLLA